jgi:V8-like Glu-specific endopeptidase
MHKFPLMVASAIAALAYASPAAAEEGMWTFDAVPTAAIQKAYGWAPDQAWLDKVQGSAVRLTGGCSASFVSAEGLILTNHHCVVSCLQDLSSKENDLVAGGYNALTRPEEKQCPGQQAEVVTKITDVTSDVQGVIAKLSGTALVQARDARIAEIEKANCTDLATTRCQVVTLFGGGQYKLYQYRKYSDVRVAWAPEFQAAFFGGDPDNFNFPRYALDASFLRAYENGKPVATPTHLQWDARAPKNGEITFVVGNPGSTQRLLAESQRDFLRSQALPLRLILMSEYRGRLLNAMKQSPDHNREAGDTLFGIENSFKVFNGQLRALNDPKFKAALAASEADLRSKAAGNSSIGDPWGEIDAAVAGRTATYLDANFLTSGPTGYSTLAGYARTLVRAAAERSKPNAERKPGFTDSALPLLEKRLFDATPTYPWLEQLGLEFWASKTREYLGADNGDVKKLFGADSPESFAEKMVKGSTLADPAVRKQLWEGGAEAIAKSNDPLIRFYAQLEPRSRAIEDAFDRDYDAPVTAAQSRLSQARFAAYGDANYPDATFTLRLSYGQVKGWNERGTEVTPTTQIGGTYDRATGQFPYILAKGFETNKARINPKLTYDFTSTNDIIGGNSGSPVIDRNGHVIGAAFDGNIHSLGGSFGYDPALNRTISVSTATIQEALDKIWPAPALSAELNGKRAKR